MSGYMQVRLDCAGLECTELMKTVCTARVFSNMMNAAKLCLNMMKKSHSRKQGVSQRVRWDPVSDEFGGDKMLRVMVYLNDTEDLHFNHAVSGDKEVKSSAPASRAV
jgi:hypothetical protein